MKIPIKNVYYLFLYAWAQFPGGKVGQTGVDDSPDIPNLFAKLLAAGVRQLLRRGLDRGYSSFTEEIIGPRGRLRLDRMIKEATPLRGSAVCEFDELTHNVLHNQIIKSTLNALAHCPEIKTDLRHDLRSLVRHLHDVENLQLSGSVFRRVVLSRNSRKYQFLIRLCEFVFWSLMPDETGGAAHFQKVVDDEVRMSAVFQEFIRNFCSLHCANYRVRSEAFGWDVSDASTADLALLPRMLTDVTLRSAEHTIIIDAKFYRRTLAQGLYGSRVHSQHLYQLLAYLQHERMRNPNKGLAGVLIYPDVGRSLRLQYRLLGIPVLICTIDLGRQWQEVEVELHEVLAACSVATRRGEPRPSSSLVDADL